MRARATIPVRPSDRAWVPATTTPGTSAAGGRAAATGGRAAAAAPGAVPSPLPASETVCGANGALSLMVSEAVRSPACVGVKATTTEHDAAGAIDCPVHV